MAFVGTSSVSSGVNGLRNAALINTKSVFVRRSRSVVLKHALNHIQISKRNHSIRAEYNPTPIGDSTSTDFRVKFTDSSSGNPISVWHDVPLYANAEKTLVNYVNEIPKGTSAKMEIATDEALTPIKQDIKKGKLRFYLYGDSLVNYGALPQTWEDPKEVHPDTKCGGDNDPLDVIEIGDEVMPMGSVYAVKPLGVLALLDEGETDWKLIAIRADDPKAKLVNDVDDVEKVFPGKIHEVREWFRLYKTAEGKGENEYAFDGEAKDRKYAEKVIADTHESWRKLKSGEISNEDGLWL